MSYLSTFWQSSDGSILSEDKLLDRLLGGEFSGYAVILEDYRNLGAKLPFRHQNLKVISYSEWTTSIVAAIQAGKSARCHLYKLLSASEHICLPDIDLIHGKDSTTEVLAQTILEALPKTNIVILGDQLSTLAPYLLKLLNGHSLCYTICRDL